LIEYSQSVDESHLDYDELLSAGRELLTHPRVKEIYRAEIRRQKRDFAANIAKMGKAGAALNLTLEDVLRHNRISLGHDAKGPRVRMQFVRNFDYKAKPPVPVDYLVQTAHKDAKGEIQIESSPATGEFATGVAE
jgi:hypothetical protein